MIDADRRTEIRFFGPTEAELGVINVLHQAGLGLVHLPEQDGAGKSTIQTFYLTTSEFKTPKSAILRMRRYVAKDKAGVIIVNNDEHAILEVKDKTAKRGEGAKTKRKVLWGDFFSSEQNELLPVTVSQEMNQEPFLQTVGVQMERRYYSSSGVSIDQNYVTLDNSFRVWGFYGGDIQELEPPNILKIEVKIREQELNNENIGLELVGVGMIEQDPAYFELLLRGLYQQGLRTRSQSH